MNIAVRYYSRSGNTGKIARVIADTAGVVEQLCDKPLKEPVDVLFLGGAIYGGEVDRELKRFISSLRQDMVGLVAIFSTTAVKSSAFFEIKELIDQRDIPVSENEFHCRGRFTLVHRGRPNERDLKQAADFARLFLK